MTVMNEVTSVLKDLMSSEGRLKLRIRRSTKTLLQRYAQSEARMEAAEKLRSIGSPEAIYNLAYHYERRGQTEKARHYYERFLEVAPPRLEAVKAEVRAKLSGR